MRLPGVGGYFSHCVLLTKHSFFFCPSERKQRLCKREQLGVVIVTQREFKPRALTTSCSSREALNASDEAWTTTFVRVSALSRGNRYLSFLLYMCAYFAVTVICTRAIAESHKYNDVSLTFFPKIFAFQHREKSVGQFRNIVPKILNVFFLSCFQDQRLQNLSKNIEPINLKFYTHIFNTFFYISRAYISDFTKN